MLELTPAAWNRVRLRVERHLPRRGIDDDEPLWQGRATEYDRELRIVRAEPELVDAQVDLFASVDLRAPDRIGRTKQHEK